jgi:D-3-phosphoglycerate dehydrogenase
MRDGLAAAHGAASDRAMIDPLILDFLEWLQAGTRYCSVVMEAWRTSRPRLTVWEDVADAGHIVRRSAPGAPSWVELTPTGRAWLEACRPSRAAA